MKTLPSFLKRNLVQVLLIFFGLPYFAQAQCSVTMGPNLTRCSGQPAALGTGLTFTGQAPVTFSWSNGLPSVQNPTIPATSSNTYTVTITDANGCVASSSISLTVLPLPTVNAGADVTICAGTPTQLCAVASSPNGPITIHTWNGGPANPCWTVAPNSNATYSVTVADVAGCQKSDAITVFVNPLPVVNAGGNQSMCLSQGTMQLNGTPAGGTWSGSGVSSSGLFTAGAVGSTTLTYSFTNNNNCTATSQMVMTVTSPTVPDGGPDHQRCLNSPAFQLPNVGTWSGSPLVTPTGQFTPSAVGTHVLTVTSGTGACTATDQVVVTVLPLPVVSAGSNVSICAGGNTTLQGSASSANGAITNTVWGGGWVNNASILNPVANPPSTTTYTLFITDAANCQNSSQVEVTVNPLPTVAAGPNITLCSNAGPTTLTGQSPAGGVWSGTGVTAAGVFTPGGVGSYTITYTFTNAAGCSASATRTVTVTAPGTVNAGNDVSICLNSPAITLAGGGTWSGSTWVTPAGVFTPGATGSFTLTYTASTGLCTATDDLVVTVLALPVVSAGSNSSVCAGSGVQLNATASSANGAINTISWTGSGLSSTTILTPLATPANTTTYTITVNDVAGCQASAQTTVTVNPLPSVNAGSNITLCSNAGPTTLTGQSPAGGVWSGTGVTAAGVFTPGAVGSYTITYTFTNAAGCSASATRTVTVTAPGTVNAGNDVSICLNSPAITLAGGGTWSGSTWVTPAGFFTPGATGSFTLTYTASTGLCTATDDLVVTVLALPVVSAGANSSVCAGSNVTLNANASSANGAINTISWTGSGLSSTTILTPTATPANTTTYTITVNDVAGCQASAQTTVTVNPLPSVNAGPDITLCNQPIAHQLGGFSPAGGTWSGTGVTSAGVFTPYALGAFTLTYCFTSANGCSSCDEILIQVVDAAMADAGNDRTFCLGDASALLQPVTPGGSWVAGPHNNASGLFTPNAVGVFQVSYNLGTGTCLTTDVVQVTVFSLPTVAIVAPAAVCAGEVIQLSANSSGGAGNYQYQWSGATFSNSQIQNPTVNSSTTIQPTVVVTDANGCQGQIGSTVQVVPMPQAGFNLPAAIICQNTPISFTNTSSLAATYNWNFGNAQTSNAINPTHTYASSGVYQVTLQAFNSLGCVNSVSQSIEVIGAPVANFNLNVSQGCSPLQVLPTNQSTGSYVNYNWNINGSILNSAQPTAQTISTFGTDLNASIQLTATNICGSSSFNQSVLVHPQPVAAFSSALSSQCSPVTTQFTNTSLGNPTSFHWDLGDGTTSTAAIPAAVVYTTEESSASYIVKLVASNTCGVDSTESVVMVLPNTVHINLASSVQAGCSPLFVQFSNMTSGANNYHFDFGDNSSSTLVSPNHLFTNAGLYTVTLNADDGCSFSSHQLQIEVLQSPSVTVSASQSAVCPEETVQFSAAVSNDVTDLLWEFGDATTSQALLADHAYAQDGTYFASATATAANGCYSSASLSIQVHPKPDAAITTNNDAFCSPYEFCAQATNTQGNQYAWIIPGVTSGNSSSLCHSFINLNSAPQNYTVQLNVVSAFGCTNFAERQISVLPEPTTTFVLTQTESCVEMETVNCVVSTSGASQYNWFVNGQSYSDQMTPSFQFSGVAQHLVELVSTNMFGCTDSHQATYTIHPTPEIDIMPSVFNGCMPLGVTFENATTNGSVWQWTFSNGNHTSTAEPMMVFENEGTYSVQLLATSEHGCQQVRYFEDMIEVFPLPTADFFYTPNGDVIYELDVQFLNASSGATYYNWNFGDGFQSAEESPLHKFRKGGEYEVQLTVFNEYGCSSKVSSDVNIDNTFYVFIPNSFTPDNDGLNDVFKPVFSNTDDIASYEFVVSNRWGEAVFKTTNPDEGWIGNGKNPDYYVHNDVFNYFVVVRLKNSAINKQYKGAIQVLR